MTGDQGDIGLVLTLDDRGTPVIKKVVQGVKQELDGLSKAGLTVGSTFTEAGAKSEIATSAFSKFGNTISQHANRIAEFGGKLSAVGRQMTMTMAVVAGGLIASTKRMIDFADNMWDLHQKTGLSTEALSSFKLSAEKSGTSINGVAFAMRYLSRSLQAAQKDGKAADKMFEGMGVTTVDSAGRIRKLNDVFYDLADVFAKMDDGAEKTSLAMRLFGRSGMEMIPMFNLGSKGLRENAEMAEKLGLVLSSKTAKAADEFNDKMVELKGSMTGAYQTITSMALPILQKFAEFATNIALKIRKWADEHTVLASVLTRIATVAILVLTVVSPMLLLFGKLATITGQVAGGFASMIVKMIAFGTQIKENVYKDILAKHYALNEETGKQILLTSKWAVAGTVVKGVFSSIALPALLLAGVGLLVTKIISMVEATKKWKESWDSMMKTAPETMNAFYKEMNRVTPARSGMAESSTADQARVRKYAQDVFKNVVKGQYAGDIEKAFAAFEAGAAKGKIAKYYQEIYQNIKKTQEGQKALIPLSERLDKIMEDQTRKEVLALREKHGEQIKEMKFLADSGAFAPQFASLWVAAYEKIFGATKKLSDEEKSAMAGLGFITKGDWAKNLADLTRNIEKAVEQLGLERGIDSAKAYSAAIGEMREHIIKVNEVAIQQAILFGTTLPDANRREYESAKAVNAEFETMSKFKVESFGEMQGKFRGLADAISEAAQRGVGFKTFIERNAEALVTFGEEMTRAGVTLPPFTQSVVDQARHLKLLGDQLQAVTDANRSLQDSLRTMGKEYADYNRKLIEEQGKTRASLGAQADAFNKNDAAWESSIKKKLAYRGLEEKLSPKEAAIAVEKKGMDDLIKAREDELKKFQDQMRAKAVSIREYFETERRTFIDLVAQKEREISLIAITEKTKADIMKATTEKERAGALAAGTARLNEFKTQGLSMINEAESQATGINEKFGDEMSKAMVDDIVALTGTIVPLFETFAEGVESGFVEIGDTADAQAKRTADTWQKALGALSAAFSVLGDLFKNQAANTYTQIENIQTLANAEIAKTPSKVKEIQARATTEQKKLMTVMTRQEAAGGLVTGLGAVSGGIGRGLAGWAGMTAEQRKLAPGGKLGTIAGAVGPEVGGMVGGALGQLISGKKTTYAGTGSAVGGALGGLLGPVGGLIGSALGGLVGGLFGKKEKKTPEQQAAEQATRQMTEAYTATAKYGKISEATAQKMVELRKTMSGCAVEAMTFSDVIGDVGVKQDNINELWKGAYTTILPQYEAGTLTAEQAQKALGDSFTQLVEGAEKLGKEGSKAMTDYMQECRNFGIEVPEIAEYIRGKLGVIEPPKMTAVEGLRAMIAGVAPEANKAVEASTDLNKQMGDINKQMLELEKSPGIPTQIDQFKKLMDEASSVQKQIELNTQTINAMGDPTAIVKFREEALGLERQIRTNSLTMQTMTDTSSVGYKALADANDELERKLAGVNLQIEKIGDPAGRDKLIAANEGLEKQLAKINLEMTKMGISPETVSSYLSLKTAAEKIRLEIEKNKTALQGYGAATKEEMARIERSTLATFSSMLANGVSYTDALTSIGPALDDLIAKHTAFGTEAGGAIKELLKIRGVTEANKELMGAIDGNLAVLNALADVGSLDQQVLTDAATSTQEYYDRLVTAGLSGNQALAQMAPTLERLRFLAKEHNLTLDEGTQALIDQGVEAGIVSKEQASMQEILVQGFSTMVAAIGQIPVAIQTMTDAMNKTKEATDATKDSQVGLGGAVDDTVKRMEDAAVKGGAAWKTMQEELNNTSDAANELQDDIYGSGVGGALEKIRDLAPGVFGGLMGKIDETTKSVRGLQDGLIGIDPSKMTDEMKKQLDVFRYEAEKNKTDLGGLIGIDPNEMAGKIEEGIKKAGDIKGPGDGLISIDPNEIADKIGEGVKRAGEISGTGIITDMLISGLDGIPKRFDDMIGGFGTIDIIKPEQIKKVIDDAKISIGELDGGLIGGGLIGDPTKLTEGLDSVFKIVDEGGATAFDKLKSDADGSLSGIVDIGKGTMGALADELIRVGEGGEITFDKLKEGAVSIGDAFRQATDDVLRLASELSGISDMNTSVQVSAPQAPPISAQGGFEGYIDVPKQPIMAHRGEYVKIGQPGEFAKESNARLEELVGQLVTIMGKGVYPHLDPIIIEKRDKIIAEFVFKEYESGRRKIPHTSVEGT